MPASSELAAARLWAASRAPYLASALFACRVVPTPEHGTISVSRRWTVRADPQLVEELGVAQIGRLLIHLVAHLVRDHAERAEALGEPADRERWNRCGDAEINDDLVAVRLVPKVARDLPRDFGVDDGKLAEHYMVHATIDGPRRWDCGSGADGVPRDGEDGDPDGLDGRQGELVRLGTAATMQRMHAQQPGSVPAGWVRWAETKLPSKVDWRRVLAAEIRRAVARVSGRVDYSYRRPSRRQQAGDDVVLPTMEHPIPNVAIVCDTSGSMHDGLLARALAEVEGILTKAGLRRTQVRVLSVDTAVHAVQRVSWASQITFAGGGGTDMGRGVEAAAALRPRPSLVVVLTDGFTPWPSAPPRGVKVIVGLLTETAGHDAPWSPPPYARTVLIEPD